MIVTEKYIRYFWGGQIITLLRHLSATPNQLIFYINLKDFNKGQVTAQESQFNT